MYHRRSIDLVHSDFVFPREYCQNIENLKIETNKMLKEQLHIEQNERMEILLETQLPYSVFSLSCFCFSFVLLLDVGVVPVI